MIREDKNDISIYIDDEIWLTAPASGTTIRDSSAAGLTANIGGYLSNGDVNTDGHGLTGGTIHEFGLYNKALTVEEILGL